jgi:hypothetical protein
VLGEEHVRGAGEADRVAAVEEGGLRELIISRRRSGYLARHEFDQVRDMVMVARIRHQRESGYSEGEL